MYEWHRNLLCHSCGSWEEWETNTTMFVLWLSYTKNRKILFSLAQHSPIISTTSPTPGQDSICFLKGGYHLRPA